MAEPKTQVYAVSPAHILPNDIASFLWSIASKERRNQALRFVKTEDAARSIVSEALLRYTLLIQHDITLESMRFTKNQWGKPVAEHAGVHVNISHSGSYAVCAVDTQEIGVDVERVHTVDSKIAERFFSIQENTAIETIVNDVDKRDLFFKIWVLKESYIKAIGRGLSCPLHSFSVIPSRNNSIQLLLLDETLPEKQFRLYALDQGYYCGLCLNHENFPDQITFVSFQDLYSVLSKTISG